MEVAARKQQLREDEEVARALQAVDVTPRRFADLGDITVCALIVRIGK